jgi:hypothetical protein
MPDLKEQLWFSVFEPEQLQSGIEVAQEWRGSFQANGFPGFCKPLQQVGRIGFQVIVQRSNGDGICIQVHKTGAVSGGIHGPDLKPRIALNFSNSVPDPLFQQGQVFTGKAILVRGFRQPGALFVHHPVLFVKHQGFFVGFSDVEYQTVVHIKVLWPRF